MDGKTEREEMTGSYGGGDPLRSSSEAAYADHSGLPMFSYKAIGTDKRVWHGRNPLTAWDVELLRREGVTHILDLREPPEWEHPGRLGAGAVAVLSQPDSPISRLNVAVADCEPPSPEALDEAVAFIEAALTEQGSRVYVHCRMGSERTGAVLAAHHAKGNGLTAEDALQSLRDRGAQIRPNWKQVEAAQSWLDSRRPR